MDAPGVATIQRWIREQRIAAGGVVPIRFHVIQADFGSGVLGTVDQSQLDQTIQVLNNAFAGKGYDGVQVPGAAATGYTFSQLSVDYTLNNDWYGMAMGSREERAAKTALGRDPDGSLNFYTCGIGASGWATFPWDLRRNGVQDGVVVGWVSLPGATYLGGIPIHEVGHWVGLYHTFEGGCHADKFCGTKGDRVCDTPAEGSATSGCPGGKDTCSGLGPDPIHNYMDYSADACDDNFTPGQDARMDFMMAQYRPFIGAARLANTIGRTEPSMPAGYGDHGLRVFPNPSNPSADIQFTLVRDGRVSLRVFDVAGRQVAVLINRYLPAGAHIEVLDGAGLASGAYLVQLRAEGRTEVRRVMILK